MSLANAVRALARQPASVKARAAVAALLEARGVPAAAAVWDAAAEAAASRGQFFVALTLCRRRTRGSRARARLEQLADLYGAGRLKPTSPRRPPPMVPPRVVDVPDDGPALVEVALKLGTDLDGVGLPADAVRPDVPIFGGLPRNAFIDLASALEEVAFRRGHRLLEEGAADRRVYFVAIGSFRVERTDVDGTVRVLTRADAPALIGEMALLTSVPRRASVIAETPGIAWAIDGDKIAALGRRHEALVGDLARLVKHRLLGNLLGSSRVLRDVGAPDALLQAFELEDVPSGAEIFAQGAAAPGLYVVLHGEAEVWAVSPDASEPVRVATLTEGDTFGEMSLMTGEPTAAGVRMPDGGAVLHLPVGAYRAIRGFVPKLDEELTALADVRRGELDELLAAVPMDDGFEEFELFEEQDGFEDLEHDWLFGGVDS